MTEPLLHPQVDIIAAKIKKAGRYVKVTTNGMLLLEKAEALAEGGLDHLQVILDGPADVYDEIRGVNGGWNRAIGGIRKIRGVRPNLRTQIICAVSNLNYDYVVRTVRAIDDARLSIDLLCLQFMNFVSPFMCMVHSADVCDIRSEPSAVNEYADPPKVDYDSLI